MNKPLLIIVAMVFFVGCEENVEEDYNNGSENGVPTYDCDELRSYYTGSVQPILDSKLIKYFYQDFVPSTYFWGCLIRHQYESCRLFSYFRSAGEAFHRIMKDFGQLFRICPGFPIFI